jgi:hypothetical protein
MVPGSFPAPDSVLLTSSNIVVVVDFGPKTTARTAAAETAAAESERPIIKLASSSKRKVSFDCSSRFSLFVFFFFFVLL